MPSLGEAPSGGARALWLLWGFSKVTRRKGGTYISYHLNNGYVPRPKRSSAQHIAIAGKPSHERDVHPRKPSRMIGRLREQARSHK